MEPVFFCNSQAGWLLQACSKVIQKYIAKNLRSSANLLH